MNLFDKYDKNPFFCLGLGMTPVFHGNVFSVCVIVTKGLTRTGFRPRNLSYILLSCCNGGCEFSQFTYLLYVICYFKYL